MGNGEVVHGVCRGYWFGGVEMRFLVAERICTKAERSEVEVIMYAPVWMVAEFSVVLISDGHWKVWMRLLTEFEGTSRHHTILSVFKEFGGL